MRHPNSNLLRRSARLYLPFITIWELASGVAGSGKWWLVPFIGIMALLAVLLTVTQAIEYVAPFVYTIF